MYQVSGSCLSVSPPGVLVKYVPFRLPVYHCENQGPDVQSVVSLTSLLRVISLTVLADSIYNILIFFAEKM